MLRHTTLPLSPLLTSKWALSCARETTLISPSSSSGGDGGTLSSAWQGAPLTSALKNRTAEAMESGAIYGAVENCFKSGMDWATMLKDEQRSPTRTAFLIHMLWIFLSKRIRQQRREREHLIGWSFLVEPKAGAIFPNKLLHSQGHITAKYHRYKR